MTMSRPRRGEVWRADLEPARGAEMNKSRPVVVLSTEDVGRLPIKLVAPITAWSPGKDHIWLVRVRPTKHNGLSKESCVDTMQVRCLSLARFAVRLGSGFQSKRIQAPLTNPSAANAASMICSFGSSATAFHIATIRAAHRVNDSRGQFGLLIEVATMCARARMSAHPGVTARVRNLEWPRASGG